MEEQNPVPAYLRGPAYNGVPVLNYQPSNKLMAAPVAGYEATGEYDAGLLPGQDQENIRSLNQSGWDQVLKGTTRLLGTAVTKFATGVADLGGLAVNALNGEIASNNPLSEGLRQIEESIKEANPIYKSLDYREGSFWDKLSTGEFWADDFVDGAAYLASAWGGGKVVGSAVNATVGKSFAQLSQAGKRANMVAKGLEEGVAAGKYGQSAIDTYLANAANRMTKGERFANNLMKLGLNENKLTRAGVTAYNTMTESFAEGYDTYNTVKQDLNAKRLLALEAGENAGDMAKYRTMSDDDVHKAATEAANAVTKGNMAALLFSNYVESGWFVGSKSYGELWNKAKELRKSAGMVDGVRQAGDKLNDKFSFAGLAGDVLSGVVTEGFFEENFQSALQRYYKAIADPKLTPDQKSRIPHWVESMGTNAKAALSALAGSDFAANSEEGEGATAIFLGGILGGMIGGPTSTFKDLSTVKKVNADMDTFWDSVMDNEKMLQRGFGREFRFGTRDKSRPVDQEIEEETYTVDGIAKTRFKQRNYGKIEDVILDESKATNAFQRSVYGENMTDMSVLAAVAADESLADIHAMERLFNYAYELEMSPVLFDDDKDMLAAGFIEWHKNEVEKRTKDGEVFAKFGQNQVTLENLSKYRNIVKNSILSMELEKEAAERERIKGSTKAELDFQGKEINKEEFDEFKMLMRNHLMFEESKLTHLEYLSNIANDETGTNAGRLTNQRVAIREAIKAKKKVIDSIRKEDPFFYARFREYQQAEDSRSKRIELVKLDKKIKGLNAEYENAETSNDRKTDIAKELEELTKQYHIAKKEDMVNSDVDNLTFGFDFYNKFTIEEDGKKKSIGQSAGDEIKIVGTNRFDLPIYNNFSSLSYRQRTLVNMAKGAEAIAKLENEIDELEKVVLTNDEELINEAVNKTIDAVNNLTEKDRSYAELAPFYDGSLSERLTAIVEQFNLNIGEAKAKIKQLEEELNKLSEISDNNENFNKLFDNTFFSEQTAAIEQAIQQELYRANRSDLLSPNYQGATLMYLFNINNDSFLRNIDITDETQELALAFLESKLESDEVQAVINAVDDSLSIGQPIAELEAQIQSELDDANYTIFFNSQKVEQFGKLPQRLNETKELYDSLQAEYFNKTEDGSVPNIDEAVLAIKDNELRSLLRKEVESTYDYGIKVNPIKVAAELRSILTKSKLYDEDFNAVEVLDPIDRNEIDFSKAIAYIEALQLERGDDAIYMTIDGKEISLEKAKEVFLRVKQLNAEASAASINEANHVEIVNQKLYESLLERVAEELGEDLFVESAAGEERKLRSSYQAFVYIDHLINNKKKTKLTDSFKKKKKELVDAIQDILNQEVIAGSKAKLQNSNNEFNFAKIVNDNNGSPLHALSHILNATQETSGTVNLFAQKEINDYTMLWNEVNFGVSGKRDVMGMSNNSINNIVLSGYFTNIFFQTYDTTKTITALRKDPYLKTRAATSEAAASEVEEYILTVQRLLNSVAELSALDTLSKYAKQYSTKEDAGIKSNDVIKIIEDFRSLERPVYLSFQQLNAVIDGITSIESTLAEIEKKEANKAVVINTDKNVKTTDANFIERLNPTVDSAKLFSDVRDNMLLLMGVSGAGKTMLTKVFYEYVAKRYGKDQIVVLAHTEEAKKNLQEAVGADVSNAMTNDKWMQQVNSVYDEFTQWLTNKENAEQTGQFKKMSFNSRSLDSNRLSYLGDWGYDAKTGEKKKGVFSSKSMKPIGIDDPNSELRKAIGNDKKSNTTNTSKKMIIVDEFMALPSNEQNDLIQWANTIGAVLVALGDGSQPKGDTKSFLSNFETTAAENKRLRIKFLQPLSIGFRTNVPSISTAAYSFKDNFNKVEDVFAKSNVDVSTGWQAKMAVNHNRFGVVAPNSLEAQKDLVSAILTADPIKRKIIIVNNFADVQLYKQLLNAYKAEGVDWQKMNIEVMDYTQVQGQTADEVYIDINPNHAFKQREWSSDDLRLSANTNVMLKDMRAGAYNSIMYMSITRARNFAYIAAYDNKMFRNVYEKTEDIEKTAVNSSDEIANRIEKSNLVYESMIDLAAELGLRKKEDKKTAASEEAPVAETEPTAEPVENPTETEAEEAKNEKKDNIENEEITSVTEDNEYEQEPIGVEQDLLDEDLEAKKETDENAKKPIELPEQVKDQVAASEFNEVSISYPNEVNGTTYVAGTIKYVYRPQVQLFKDSSELTSDEGKSFVVKRKVNGKIQYDLVSQLKPIDESDSNRFLIWMGVLGDTEAENSLKSTAIDYNSLSNPLRNNEMPDKEKRMVAVDNNLPISNDLFSIALLGHNDLIMSYDKESKLSATNFDNTLYADWISQQVDELLDGLTRNNPEQQLDLIAFRQSQFEETADKRKKLKSSALTNNNENEEDFKVQLDILAQGLSNNILKGSLARQRGNEEMEALVRKYAGFPVLVIKNVPIGKIKADGKVKKTSFFIFLDRPKLKSDSSTVKVLGQYQKNVKSVADQLGVNTDDFYNTAEFNTLVYAGQALFAYNEGEKNFRANNVTIDNVDAEFQKFQDALAVQYEKNIRKFLRDRLIANKARIAAAVDNESKKNGFYEVFNKIDYLPIEQVIAYFYANIPSDKRIFEQFNADLQSMGNAINSIAFDDEAGAVNNKIVFLKSIQDLTFGNEGSIFSFSGEKDRAAIERQIKDIEWLTAEKAQVALDNLKLQIQEESAKRTDGKVVYPKEFILYEDDNATDTENTVMAKFAFKPASLDTLDDFLNATVKTFKVELKDGERKLVYDKKEVMNGANSLVNQAMFSIASNNKVVAGKTIAQYPTKKAVNGKVEVVGKLYYRSPLDWSDQSRFEAQEIRNALQLKLMRLSEDALKDLSMKIGGKEDYFKVRLYGNTDNVRSRVLMSHEERIEEGKQVAMAAADLFRQQEAAGEIKVDAANKTINREEAKALLKTIWKSYSESSVGLNEFKVDFQSAWLDEVVSNYNKATSNSQGKRDIQNFDDAVINQVVTNPDSINANVSMIDMKEDNKNNATALLPNLSLINHWLNGKDKTKQTAAVKYIETEFSSNEVSVTGNKVTVAMAKPAEKATDKRSKKEKVETVANATIATTTTEETASEKTKEPVIITQQEEVFNKSEEVTNDDKDFVFEPVGELTKKQFQEGLPSIKAAITKLYEDENDSPFDEVATREVIESALSKLFVTKESLTPEETIQLSNIKETASGNTIQIEVLDKKGKKTVATIAFKKPTEEEAEFYNKQDKAEAYIQSITQFLPKDAVRIVDRLVDPATDESVLGYVVNGAISLDKEKGQSKRVFDHEFFHYVFRYGMTSLERNKLLRAYGKNYSIETEEELAEMFESWLNGDETKSIEQLPNNKFKRLVIKIFNAFERIYRWILRKPTTVNKEFERIRTFKYNLFAPYYGKLYGKNSLQSQIAFYDGKEFEDMAKMMTSEGRTKLAERVREELAAAMEGFVKIDGKYTNKLSEKDANGNDVSIDVKALTLSQAVISTYRKLLEEPEDVYNKTYIAAIKNTKYGKKFYENQVNRLYPDVNELANISANINQETQVSEEYDHAEDPTHRFKSIANLFNRPVQLNSDKVTFIKFDTVKSQFIDATNEREGAAESNKDVTILPLLTNFDELIEWQNNNTLSSVSTSAYSNVKIKMYEWVKAYNSFKDIDKTDITKEEYENKYGKIYNIHLDNKGEAIVWIEPKYLNKWSNYAAIKSAIVKAEAAEDAYSDEAKTDFIYEIVNTDGVLKGNNVANELNMLQEPVLSALDSHFRKIETIKDEIKGLSNPEVRNLVTQVYNRLLTASMAYNNLRTIANSAGSWKFNNFTEDVVDYKYGRKTMERNSAVATQNRRRTSESLYGELLGEMAIVHSKDVLDAKAKLKSGQVADFEEYAEAVMKVIMSPNTVFTQDSILQEIIKLQDTKRLPLVNRLKSAIKHIAMDIIQNRDAEIAESENGYMQKEETVDEDSVKVRFVKDIVFEDNELVKEELGTIIKIMADETKMSLSKVLIMKTKDGKSLYTLTDSTYLNDVISRSMAFAANPDSVNFMKHYKAENYRYNIFIGDKSKRLSRFIKDKDVNKFIATHDAFFNNATGQSKPMERESDVEALRRHLVFSFLAPLAKTDKTVEKTPFYHQDTFQLEARTRAQYVNVKFLNKSEVIKGIENMLNSVQNFAKNENKLGEFVKIGQKRNSRNANDDYGIMNMLVTDEKDDAVTTVEIDGKTVNFSFDYIKGLQTNAEITKLANAIYNKLYNQAERLADNITAWDIDMIPDIEKVVKLLSSKGREENTGLDTEYDYLSTKEADELLGLLFKVKNATSAGKQFQNTDFERNPKDDKGNKHSWFDELTDEEKLRTNQLLSKVLHGYIGNRYVNMYFMNQMIAGDFVFYKDTRTLVKRLLGASSPGRLPIVGKGGMPHTTKALVVNDPKMYENTWKGDNKELNAKAIKDLRKIDFIAEYLDSKEINETNINESVINEISERISEKLSVLNQQAINSTNGDNVEENQKEILAILSEAASLESILQNIKQQYSSSIEMFLDAVLSKQYNLDNPVELAEKSKRLNEILKFYSAPDITDGQSLMTEEGYNELLSGMDPAFGLAGTIKSMYYGQENHIPQLDNSGFVTPLYVKNSYFVLSEKLMEQFPELRIVSDFIKDHGAKELHFGSAIKVGAPKKAIDFFDVVNYKGATTTFTQNLADAATVVMHNKFRRIQFNPLAEFEKAITLPSQMMYMINVNTSMPELAKLAYEAQAFLIEKEMSKLVSGEIKSNLGKYLKKIIAKSPEAVSMFQTLGQSDEELSRFGLTDPYIRNKFVTAVISDITKASVNIKLRGAKLVLASGDLLSNNNKTLNSLYGKLSKEGKLDDLSNVYEQQKRLQVHTENLSRTINGDVQVETQLYADVIVPAGMFESTPEVLEKMRKGEIMFKTGDLLSMRLPTTGKNSGVVFRVVGTHDLKENIVFMPTEIMAIHGSDFDVDSLFTLQREFWNGDTVTLTNAGRVVNIAKGDFIGYKYQRYKRSTDSNDSSKDHALLSFDFNDATALLDMLAINKKRANSELVSTSSKERDKIKLIRQQLRDIDKIESMLLRNILVETMHSSLTNQAHFEQMITPISSTFIDDVLDNLRTEGKDGMGWSNYFDGSLNLSMVTHSIKMQRDNQVGAAATGFGANGFKTYSYISKAGYSPKVIAQLDKFIFDSLDGKVEGDKRMVNVNKYGLYDKYLEQKGQVESDKSRIKKGEPRWREMNKSQAIDRQIFDMLPDNVKSEYQQLKNDLSKESYEDNTVDNTYSEATVEKYKDSSMAKLNRPISIDNTTYYGLSELSYYNKGTKDKPELEVVMYSWDVLNAFINESIDNPKNTKLTKMGLNYDNFLGAVAMIMVGIPYHKKRPIVPYFIRQPFMNLMSYGRLAGITNFESRMAVEQLEGKNLIVVNGQYKDSLGKKKRELPGIGTMLAKAIIEIELGLGDKGILENKKYIKYNADTDTYYLDIEGYAGKSEITLEGKNGLTEYAKYKYTEKLAKVYDLFNKGKLSTFESFKLLVGDNGVFSTKEEALDFLKFQLRAIDFYMPFHQMAGEVKQITTLLNTLRENPTDISGIMETIDNVGAITSEELSPRYERDMTFSDYKKRIERGGFDLKQKPSDILQIPNFLNKMPNVYAAMLATKTANDLYEEYVPTYNPKFRKLVEDTIKYTKLESEKASFVFKKGNKEQWYNGEKLLLNELERVAMVYASKKAYEELREDFDDAGFTVDMATFTEYIPSIATAFNAFKGMPAHKNNSVFGKISISTTGRLSLGNNNLNDEDEAMNAKNHVDSYYDKYVFLFDKANPRIVAKWKTVKVDGKDELEENDFGDTPKMELIHILGYLSALSNQISGEGESKLYRILPNEVRNNIGSLKITALDYIEELIDDNIDSLNDIITESKDSLDIKGLREKLDANPITELKRIFLFNVIKRNLKYVKELRHAPDYGIEIAKEEAMNNGNKINVFRGDKAIAVQDYSGVEQIEWIEGDKLSESPIYFDLKVISTEKQPYIVSFKGTPYIQIKAVNRRKVAENAEKANEQNADNVINKVEKVEKAVYFQKLPTGDTILDEDYLKNATNGFKMVLFGDSKETAESLNGSLGKRQGKVQFNIKPHERIASNSNSNPSVIAYLNDDYSKPLLIELMGQPNVIKKDDSSYKGKKLKRAFEMYEYEFKELDFINVDSYRNTIETKQDLMLLAGDEVVVEDETALDCSLL